MNSVSGTLNVLGSDFLSPHHFAPTNGVVSGTTSSSPLNLKVNPVIGGYHHQQLLKLLPNASDQDLNPDSNVYVANLPSNYGRDNLYQLFSEYGEIVRHKFVQPEDPNQPGYGFVQFARVSDAHKAIASLEGMVFNTGEKIYLSIALRRRSSLSDEPTNLYVKNVPNNWTNERLRQIFGMYGNIRQSKVMGDGIAFVRFESHEQALIAIDNLDKKEIGEKALEVRFATRKTAVTAYKAGAVPTQKSNQNNLYVRNLPKGFTQSDLETVFQAHGKISSGKINDNGVAFVRYADHESAQRAIDALNGTKPKGFNFDQDIVVKFAHFDIGDSRNRWRVNYHNHGPFNQHVSAQNPPVPYTNLLYTKHLTSHLPGYSPSSNTNSNSNLSFNFRGLGGQMAGGSSTLPTSISSPLNLGNQDVLTNLQQLSHMNQVGQHQLNQLSHQMQTMSAAPQMSTLDFSLPLLQGSLSNLSSPVNLPNLNNLGSPIDTEKKTLQNLSSQQQEQGDLIYRCAFAKYPEYASKITGMILGFGEERTSRVLQDYSLLEKKIEQAYVLLTKNDSFQETTKSTVESNNIALKPSSLGTQNLLGMSSPLTTKLDMFNSAPNYSGNQSMQERLKKIQAALSGSPLGNVGSFPNVTETLTQPMNVSSLGGLPSLNPPSSALGSSLFSAPLNQELPNLQFNLSGGTGTSSVGSLNTQDLTASLQEALRKMQNIGTSQITSTTQ